MSNKLRLFQFDHCPVRVVIDEAGEPWWVARDVCEVLGLTNSREALSALDEDEKDTVRISDGTPGNPNLATINEPGLYSLVLRSRKPEARRFKRWVTHEVLPSLRKTGSYELQGKQIPQNFQEALRALADEVDSRERLEVENMRLAPKAVAWDATCREGSDMSLQAVGKEFQRLGTGPRKIFAFLASQGVLFRLDGSWVPKQRYIDSDHFRVHRAQVEIGEEIRSYCRTMVTPKGRDLIAKLLGWESGKVVPFPGAEIAKVGR